jgi:predicted nucleic acid-binding protein
MPAEVRQTLYIAEPSGAYSRRNPLVVDCSVIAAMVFDEDRHDEAVAALDGQELFAPHLIDHELVNVAVNKARSGLKTTATEGLEHFAMLAITRYLVDYAAQFRTALEHDLTAYDAAYLQLALDLGAPLATFDQRLGAAARRALAG